MICGVFKLEMPYRALRPLRELLLFPLKVDVFKLEMPHRALRLVNQLTSNLRKKNFVLKTEMPHRGTRITTSTFAISLPSPFAAAPAAQSRIKARSKR